MHRGQAGESEVEKRELGQRHDATFRQGEGVVKEGENGGDGGEESKGGPTNGTGFVDATALVSKSNLIR
jgi:hypothetical protein